MIAKDAPFTTDEIRVMPDAEAWAWLYTHRPPKKRPKLPEICFTGLGEARRHELEAEAKARGYCVVTKVTKHHYLLCAGANAGPSKLAKAEAQGVQVISEDDFLTGGEGDI